RSVLGKHSKATQEIYEDVRAPSSPSLPIRNASQLTREESEELFFQFLFASSHNEPLTVPQKLVIDVVKESLAKKEYRLTAVPRLPMVIPKLLRSLRDPESSVRDYVAIVNKDAVMSAAVLKLANSVYSNPIGSYIGDIERAI